jgi:hypothetical protein
VFFSNYVVTNGLLGVFYEDGFKNGFVLLSCDFKNGLDASDG